MHTQRIDLMRQLTRGTLFLALIVVCSFFTQTAHANHPLANSEYQVNALLGKAAETLVIMQEGAETEYTYTEKTGDTGYYDYTKKKESTEPYYDYTKKDATYTDTEYKKTTVTSAADIELLLEQIKQLQALIMLLIELQAATLGQNLE